MLFRSYTLTSFTSEINTGETVKLTVKITTNTPDESIGETPPSETTPDNTEEDDRTDEQRITFDGLLNNLFN